MCESLIDGLTFWCAGYRHVTASYGANGFRADLFDAFLSHPIKRVLIAYDRDEAGDKGAMNVAYWLQRHKIECFRIHFPPGMDADEVAVQSSSSPEPFSESIRKAEWIDPATVPVPESEKALHQRMNRMLDKTEREGRAKEEPSRGEKTANKATYQRIAMIPLFL